MIDVLFDPGKMKFIGFAKEERTAWLII